MTQTPTLDSLLKTSVTSQARERKFLKKGRHFYRRNILGDVVVAYFQPLQTLAGPSFRVLISLSRHLSQASQNVLDLDIGEAGEWWWLPGPPGSDDKRSWALDLPDIERLLESSWAEWMDVMDEIVRPGALTAELREPTYQLPGVFKRSEEDLAYSLLNDEAVSEETSRILLEKIALRWPHHGRTLQLRLHAS